MGGVQRVLLGAFLYADWASTAGASQHIKLIRDKATFAHLVTTVFGDFEKELRNAQPPKDEGVQTVLSWFD